MSSFDWSVCHVNASLWWTSLQTWQSAVAFLPLAFGWSHGAVRKVIWGWKAVCSFFKSFDILPKVRAQGATINDGSPLIRSKTNTPGPGYRMNSYLDYQVCSRGANIFSAKAGYSNLNHGYSSASSCATSDSYAPDACLVPHQGPNVPLHHQPHVNLDLQFSAAGNPMYGSTLDYGHHQYGLAPDQDRSFMHAQVSPLGTSAAPYPGDAIGPGQYMQYPDQRQQEYPESVYRRLPPQCKEKEQGNVEEASKTFDWMKVKRNPPKTGWMFIYVLSKWCVNYA